MKLGDNAEEIKACTRSFHLVVQSDIYMKREESVGLGKRWESTVAVCHGTSSSPWPRVSPTNEAEAQDKSWLTWKPDHEKRNAKPWAGLGSRVTKLPYGRLWETGAYDATNILVYSFIRSRTKDDRQTGKSGRPVSSCQSNSELRARDHYCRYSRERVKVKRHGTILPPALEQWRAVVGVGQ